MTKTEIKNLKINLLLILALILVLLGTSCCATKHHVITEYDGDREIRWYTTEKQE
jgi:hypothetical protein